MNSLDITFASQKWQHLAINSNRRGSLYAQLLFFFTYRQVELVVRFTKVTVYGEGQKETQSQQAKTPPSKNKKPRVWHDLCGCVQFSRAEKLFLSENEHLNMDKFMQHAAPHSWSLWATDATEN